jgi:chromatin remodeling complex protein RSC6
MNEELVTTSEPVNAIVEQFNIISDSLTLFKMQISTLQQQIKGLEKNVKKELKNIKKETIKNKQKVKRAPSGFAKPTKVSKELCEFMQKPEGTEIARTEVTRALITYIKTNKLLLENDETKKKIVPDEKLKKLLGIDNGELNNLDYFNIQKYMNKHFITKKTVLNENELNV